MKYLLLCLVFLCNALWALEADPLFPTPPSFEKRVQFWKTIYTEVDGNEGLIHDTEDFFIYEKIKINPESERKKNKKLAKEAKDRVSKRLLAIAEKAPENLSPEEKELFVKLGSPNAGVLRERAKQIRFQKGQKDKFYSGLIRSQLYIDYIKKEFRSAGLPERLAYLPHVESSFNYQAYSKVGAAGIWQFMRSTGKLFMRVNYQVDERRDPIIATRGAIRLLRSNYERLGAWPLAVTAYNHGPESIAKAIAKLNTRDIDVIIDDYKAKKFKFASKNFYACFLAASEIAMNPKAYFGEIPAEASPLKYTEITLKEKFTVREILSTTKISEKTFKDYNLALRPIVYKKNLPLPIGFIVKIPSVDKPAIAALEERVKQCRPSPTPLLGLAVATPTVAPIPTNTPAPVVAVATPPAKEESELKVKMNRDLSLVKKGKDQYLATIQHSENLTLFAEWLEGDIKSILKANKMKGEKPLALGKKILLPIAKNKLEDFKSKREEYHLGVEEDFFDNYKILGFKKYKVKKGQTFASIAESLDIPVWLLIQIQGDFFTELRAGQSISIPSIEARKEVEAPVIPGSDPEKSDEDTEELPNENFNPM